VSASADDTLPDGLLVAWYGDDFTGSAAVMEVLTFAGLPAVLFFDLPTPAQLARFAGHRGIGIAGIARSKGPAWMADHLPPVFEFLAGLRAPISHYKTCSTFDSAPHVGSIGKAADLAAPILGGAWHPLLLAAPAIQRYQAFGNLFAGAGGVTHRLDRHPTMSRHPVTPMDEADVRLHLARQTRAPIGLVDLVAMTSGRPEAVLDAQLEQGSRIIALDAIDEDSLAEAGRLIWQRRGERLFAIGSQGVEYALAAHWRRAGLMDAAPPPARAAAVDHIAAVSGSCSPVTAEQIAWAEQRGFEPIRIDPARAIYEVAWQSEVIRAVEAALGALSSGRDPIVLTARGPEDPAIASFDAALQTSGCPKDQANQRIGAGLGQVLDRLLREGGLRRGLIAGGDTSGHGALTLGIYALTARAPLVPGAALFEAHSDDPAHAGLEIALKGGQMGTPDYFGRVKQGGAAA
jgi:uncharacterized protein YgbK (DUF1537 family)